MKGKSALDWAYVAGQFVIIILFLQDYAFVEWKISKDMQVFFKLIAGMSLLWATLAALSMNTLVSPFPSPKKGLQLQTTGVYEFTRHPIYTGLILFFYTWAIAQSSEYKLCIAALFHLFIFLKARFEEKLLLQQFPTYKSYQKKTGMFFPKIKF